MDTPVLLVVVVAAVVVLVVGVVMYATGRVRASRRTARLRRQFGEEYERTVDRYGGRRDGEAELEARLRHRQQLSIRQLDPAERDRFNAAWESAQATFVNTPSTGLRQADTLVMEVMRERGYAVDSFSERARLVSVDYPDIVEHFRVAHEVSVADEQDSATTEQMRRAMVDYRYLFEELIGAGASDRSRRPQDP